ncbi:MAG: SDR family NAD(P)-dependent oxidoreductase [Chloroflexota bacterium]
MNTANHLPFALITGASSGIGAAFARRLAADGYNLILVARRKQRLDALASEIRAKHAVLVESFPADLAQPVDVERVVERIRACEELDLLVNNAGFGQAGCFWEDEEQGQLDMVQVHVAATVRLTRAALPVMLAHQKGGIINVSSVAAFVARGSATLYHATKASLIAFSRGLALELRKTPVKVQALCPGFTVTEFHDSPEYKNFQRSSVPNFMWLTAEQIVNPSLAELRKGKNVVVVPGLLYQLLVFMTTSPLTQPLMRLLAVTLFKRER